MSEQPETPGSLSRVAFIFNPASGNEAPESRRRQLQALAQEVGLHGELLETDPHEGAVPAAHRALTSGAERVLVAGGDGSVAEVAGVLAGTKVALAVIPGGTGNLLAVNLGLPTDPAEAMRKAVTAPAYPTDIGRANGRVFLIIAGIGVDAQMIRDADRELKNRLGFLAYFVAAWRNRRRTRSSYTLTIDGRRFRRRAHTVMIANLGRVTGGVELIPATAPEGGSLQVGILRASSLWALTQVAAAALLGNRQRDTLLENYRGRTIRIETAQPQPVQLDGNEAGHTRLLEITVEPGALQLVRPALPSGLPAPTPPLPAAITTVRSRAPLFLGVGVVLAFAWWFARKRTGR